MLSHYISVYGSAFIIMVLLVAGVVEFTKWGNSLHKGICAVNSNGTNEIKIIWNLDGYSGNMTLSLTQTLITYINKGCYIRGDFTTCPCWLTTNNPNYINLDNDNPGWESGIVFLTMGIFITIISVIVYTIREFQIKMRCCHREYKMI